MDKIWFYYLFCFLYFLYALRFPCDKNTSHLLFSMGKKSPLKVKTLLFFYLIYFFHQLPDKNRAIRTKLFYVEKEQLHSRRVFLIY